MSDEETQISHCEACGSAMDVSGLAPFSHVACPECGAEIRVKVNFGSYTLTQRHAIGGMSVVFLAHDRTLNREAVVKILNDEYRANDRRILAFEDEARITASISHPHVVRIFTTGRAFGQFFIAMEFVRGGDLESWIQEKGAIAEIELLPLALQVASGLQAAQTAGLIHRDMKPGNILIDEAGNAKIVDFGLALVTKGGNAQAQEIWATPYYVPPEAVEGQPEDFRSDLYSFGATLYHALAGQPPCAEETMDTDRLRVSKKKVRPLAKAAPWISEGTCYVVDRAMAYDPEARFASYEELIAAAESAFRERMAMGAAGHGGSGRRAAVRRAKAIAAALALAAVGGWAAWHFRPVRTVPQDEMTTQQPQPNPAEHDNSLRISSAYRGAGEALRLGDFSKAADLFAEVSGLPGVLEPTGSWAACEAVIAGFLDGRSDRAMVLAEAAAEHVRAAEGLDGKARTRLAETLEVLRELPPITRDAEAPDPQGAEVLVALLAGLKNWEQGMPDQALPHFEAVLRGEGDSWAEPYRDILRSYLNDAEVLREKLPEELPDDPVECRVMAVEVGLLHAKLKTKGRARFNVDALKKDLETRAAYLESRDD